MKKECERDRQIDSKCQNENETEKERGKYMSIESGTVSLSASQINVEMPMQMTKNRQEIHMFCRRLERIRNKILSSCADHNREH